MWSRPCLTGLSTVFAVVLSWAAVPVDAGAAGAVAAPPTGAPSQQQIAATEGQISALEATITHEQGVIDQTDEQYNQAQVALARTEARLQDTNARLAALDVQLSLDRGRLRNDALVAYMTGSSASELATYFATPTAADQVRSTYESVLADDITKAANALSSDERQARAARDALASEERAQAADAASVDATRRSAQAAAGAAQATLTSVKGTFAQEVAAQAAAQAQAAARAAAQAAAADQAAAARAAAQRAAQAAAVAETLVTPPGSPSGGPTGGPTGVATAVDTAVQTAKQAAGSAASSAGAATGLPVGYGGSPTAAGLAAVNAALSFLGVPYVWGGASRSGVDCSGLVMVAWEAAGVSLLHSAADQYAESASVPLDQLEPGDLLFYDLDGTGIDHVVMYVGPTVNGQPTPYGADTIVQAAYPGTVVSYDPLWISGLVGAGRP